MTEPQSTEAAKILQRLRQQIEYSGSQSESRGAGSMPVNLAASNLQFEPSDLAPLRAEVDTALAGHRDVGQIKPCEPGLRNRVVHFINKVIRRSLSWYTRPIHIFQGAVIRALQQIVSHLQRQQELASNLAGELVSVAEQVARTNQASAGTREELVAHVACVKTEVLEQVSELGERLTGEVDGTKADLWGQLSRTADELSGQIASTKTDFTKQLSQAGDRLSGQLEGAKTDLRVQISGTRDELSGQIENTKTALWEQVSKNNDEMSGQIVRIEDAAREQISKTNADLSSQIAGVGDSTLQQLDQFKRIVDDFRAELGDGRNELLEVIRKQRQRERDVRRFIDAVERGVTSLPSIRPRPTPPMFASDIKHQDEFDYFVFEDLFRGDESLIRDRQAEYLKYFLGRENVIDVGCGRGEFLEVLRDNGITARGVELGTDQFLLCREKGLDVVQDDLFSFLESLPDDSIGGLFSAQVIEHLTASDQLRYVALAYRKCQPGSPVIFETINAQCVFAVMRNFFLDPTHVRPVHPETLKFAMESVSFRDVQLKFMSPVTDRQIPPLNIAGDTEEMEKFNAAIRQLNDLIYGYQDYAAIGWR